MKLVTNVQGAKAETVARDVEKLAERAGSPVGLSIQENGATDQVTIVVDSDSLRQTAKNLRQQAALLKVQAGRTEAGAIEAQNDGQLQSARATEKKVVAEHLEAESKKATEEGEQARQEVEKLKAERAENDRKRNSVKESIAFEERRAKSLRQEGQYKLSFADDPMEMQAARDLLAAADVHLVTASVLRTGDLAPLERLADALKDNQDRVSRLALESLEYAKNSKASSETARTDATTAEGQAKVSFQTAETLKGDAADLRGQVRELEVKAVLQEAIAASGDKSAAGVLAAASA